MNIGNRFQDVKMNPLRSAQRIPVKKEKKACLRFLSQEGQWIQENQGGQISDPEKYPKEFYFRDIMHGYLGAGLRRPQIYP